MIHSFRHHRHHPLIMPSHHVYVSGDVEVKVEVEEEEEPHYFSSFYFLFKRLFSTILDLFFSFILWSHEQGWACPWHWDAKRGRECRFQNHDHHPLWTWILGSHKPVKNTVSFERSVSGGDEPMNCLACADEHLSRQLNQCSHWWRLQQMPFSLLSWTEFHKHCKVTTLHPKEKNNNN